MRLRRPITHSAACSWRLKAPLSRSKTDQIDAQAGNRLPPIRSGIGLATPDLRSHLGRDSLSITSQEVPAILGTHKRAKFFDKRGQIRPIWIVLEQLHHPRVFQLGLREDMPGASLSTLSGGASREREWISRCKKM